jgi:biopolymer transport protein ExbB/TolQ
MPFWMTIAEWASRIILILLVFLSIWSVSIMLDRRKFFQKLDKEKEGSPWKNTKASGGSSEIFWQRGANQLSQNKNTVAVERNFENFIETERPYLEKGLPVLGTLGSTAPFIGLLGTILGIIKAFGELSINAMNTNKIMFLLAEALILTAIGLAVAIPSVVAFNYFQRKVRQQIASIRIMKNDFQNSSGGNA